MVTILGHCTLTEHLLETRRLRSRAIKSMLGLETGGEDELARDKDTSGQSKSLLEEHARQQSQTSIITIDLEEEAVTTASVVVSGTPTQSGRGVPSISSRKSPSPDGHFGTETLPFSSLADIPGYPEYLSNFLTNWKASSLDEFEFPNESPQLAPSIDIHRSSLINHGPPPSDKTAPPSASCGCRSPAPWVAVCCPHGKDPNILFSIIEANAFSTPSYQMIELLIEYYFKYFHLGSFPVMSEWNVYQLMHFKTTSKNQPAKLMSLALLNAIMFTASAVCTFTNLSFSDH